MDAIGNYFDGLALEPTTFDRSGRVLRVGNRVSMGPSHRGTIIWINDADPQSPSVPGGHARKVIWIEFIAPKGVTHTGAWYYPMFVDRED